MKNLILLSRKEILKKYTNSPEDSIKNPILNTTQPNVILLIWESLTAKVVASLGGDIRVTENLDKLTKEGILFTNFLRKRR